MGSGVHFGGLGCRGSGCRGFGLRVEWFTACASGGSFRVRGRGIRGCGVCGGLGWQVEVLVGLGICRLFGAYIYIYIFIYLFICLFI